jgi:hypothetical protein
MDNPVKDPYERRVKDILATTNHREPERVPVLANVLTWPLAYAGVTVEQCLADRDLYIRKCNQIFEDFYFDSCFVYGIVMPMEAISILESTTYFVSDDKVTIQHRENCPMLPEEYPELIKDPAAYLANTFFPRKFPALNAPYPENLAALKRAGQAFVKHLETRGTLLGDARERFGIVSLTSAKSYPPLDVIFDRLRGFKDLLLDLKRRPDLVGQAIEALYPIYAQVLENSVKGEFPFAVTTMHCPTFLGAKEFEKFFWPTYKRTLLKGYDNDSFILGP